MAARFEELPPELLHQIFSYASTLTRIRARSVCRYFHTVISDPYLWRTLAVADMLIPYPSINPAWMETFRHAPYLVSVTTLDFSYCCALTDDMVATLATVAPRTETLVLDGCTSLTKSTFGALGGLFPRLSSLSLAELEAAFTPADLKHLVAGFLTPVDSPNAHLPTVKGKTFPGLTSLDISQSKVSPKNINVSALTTLTSLACSGSTLHKRNPYMDSSVASDSKLPISLTDLDFSHHTLNHRYIRDALTQLVQDIETAHPELIPPTTSHDQDQDDDDDDDDTWHQKIKPGTPTKLDVINFSRSKVDVSAWIASHCPSLTVLRLTASSITNFGLKAIAQYVHTIREATLSFTSVTGAALVPFVRANRQLEILDLQHCSISLDHFLDMVPYLGCVKRLCLSRTALNTDAIFALADGAPNLVELDYDTTFVERHAIYTLVEKASNLTRVNATSRKDPQAWEILSGAIPITRDSPHGRILKENTLGQELFVRYPELAEHDPSDSEVFFAMAVVPSLKERSSTLGTWVSSSDADAGAGKGKEEAVEGDDGEEEEEKRAKWLSQDRPFRITSISGVISDTRPHRVHCLTANPHYAARAVSLEEIRAHHYATSKRIQDRVTPSAFRASLLQTAPGEDRKVPTSVDDLLSGAPSLMLQQLEDPVGSMPMWTSKMMTTSLRRGHSKTPLAELARTVDTLIYPNRTMVWGSQDSVPRPLMDYMFGLPDTPDFETIKLLFSSALEAYALDPSESALAELHHTLTSITLLYPLQSSSSQPGYLALP